MKTAKTRTVHYPHSTEQFADSNNVKSQSVRKRLCETGSYFGIVPKKLANGRLAWPDRQVLLADYASQEGA